MTTQDHLNYGKALIPRCGILSQQEARSLPSHLKRTIRSASQWRAFDIFVNIIQLYSQCYATITEYFPPVYSEELDGFD